MRLSAREPKLEATMFFTKSVSAAGASIALAAALGLGSLALEAGSVLAQDSDKPAAAPATDSAAPADAPADAAPSSGAAAEPAPDNNSSATSEPAATDSAAPDAATAAPPAPASDSAAAPEAPAAAPDDSAGAQPAGDVAPVKPQSPETADTPPAAAPSDDASSSAAASDQPAAAVSAKDLEIGTAVFGADGAKIGEVNRVTTNAAGDVEEIHVTDGGAAGLNAKAYAVPADKITGVKDGVKLSLSAADVKKLPLVDDNGKG
jgi:hypothetical protein